MTGNLKMEEVDRRLRAYLDASSDEEAAKKLKMQPGTFSQWRNAKKLPARGEPIVARMSVGLSDRRQRALKKASNGSSPEKILLSLIDKHL